MRNKRTKTKISIWCEGKTELNYFDSIKPIVAKENINIECEELKRTDFKDISVRVDKEYSVFDKIFIVIDLVIVNNNKIDIQQ